jgi:hypothetical protein
VALDRGAVLEELRRSLAGPLAPHEEERRRFAAELLPHVRRYYENYVDFARHEPFYRVSTRR